LFIPLCRIVPMPRFIALLRGVNVGGRNSVPMRELCALCRGLGWDTVRSYIQSGNVIFTASGAERMHESALEGAITERFSLSIPAIVRTCDQWRDYVAGNPFADISAAEPNRVILALAKSPPKPDAADALRRSAQGGEIVRASGDALWVHFPHGQGKSKLTPAVFDRCAGSPVTMRNARTVRTIMDLLDAAG
jgi:uncharacterized protein (DUF1697 family)